MVGPDESKMSITRLCDLLKDNVFLNSKICDLIPWAKAHWRFSYSYYDTDIIMYYDKGEVFNFHFYLSPCSVWAEI